MCLWLLSDMDIQTATTLKYKESQGGRSGIAFEEQSLDIIFSQSGKLLSCIRGLSQAHLQVEIKACPITPLWLQGFLKTILHHVFFIHHVYNFLPGEIFLLLNFYIDCREGPDFSILYGYVFCNAEFFGAFWKCSFFLVFWSILYHATSVRLRVTSVHVQINASSHQLIPCCA